MTKTPKTILVTGAFGGIGKAVCRELSLQGHMVIGAVRRLPAGDAVSRQSPGPILHIEADLASVDGWKHVLEAVRSGGVRIDTLIHCAGTLIPCDISSVGAGELRKMIDDNILTLMLACRAVVPNMRAARDGHIVILGSLGGMIPMPHQAVYSATKYAVRGFVLSLAEELRRSGIAVSLISCGPVHTPMLAGESRHAGSISFFNSPLSPGRVVRAVLAALDHPGGETLLPRIWGLIAPIVGAFPWLFRQVYPLVSTIGRARKLEYQTKASTCMDFSGRRQ